MGPEVECYFVLLDLHGPETTYLPLYNLLRELGAVRLPAGFPVWMFNGQPDSHNMYLEKFAPLLPPWSIDRPDVRFGFLLMSARGYGSYGKFQAKLD